MDYFKPEKYYYIIPILRIDAGIKICFDDGLINHTLHDYMNERFPILKQLDVERADILYNDPLWKVSPQRARKKLSKQMRLIEASIDRLNLPQHVLAIGTDDGVVEPVTKVKIVNTTELKSLRRYRVNDGDLHNYWIQDYESKINEFFFPKTSTIELAHKPKEEFIMEVKLTKQGAKIKTIN